MKTHRCEPVFDVLPAINLPLRTEESSHYQTPLEDCEWRNLIELLSSRVAKLDPMLVANLATAIARGIEWLNHPMERYCSIAYASCSECCCAAQEVYYNRADLLYLIAFGKALPIGQTRSHAGDPCRFLGPDGCLLPRLYRPYVCTWFLCDAHIQLWKQENSLFQRKFAEAFLAIRIGRLQLETLYEQYCD